MTKIGKRLIAGSAMAALLFGIVGCSGGVAQSSSSASGDRDVSLLYASGVPATSGLGKSVNLYVSDAEKTVPSVKFHVAASGTLLSIADTLKGIQDGRADTGYVNVSYTGTATPLWNIVGVPFITHNADAENQALISLLKTNKAFQNEFNKLGVKVLHFIPTSSGSYGGKKAMTSLADYKGVRIRGIGLDATAEQALGASELFVPLDQLFDGLQRGTIDSWSGLPINLVGSGGYFQLRKYVTDPGFGQYSSAASMISDSSWKKLSKNQQKGLLAAATKYYPVASKELEQQDAAGCKQVLAAGAHVSALPSSQVDKWKALVQDKIFASWQETAVKAGVSVKDAEDFKQQYLAAVTKAEKTSTYKDQLEVCAKSSN
jgi:TRAP-type C4-dicarboxylate transport system substrate-binding protein